MTLRQARGVPDGFINLPVTKTTREGLHLLKEHMDARSQEEVIARLVHMGLGAYAALSAVRRSSTD